jgi:hypothetical protein
MNTPFDFMSTPYLYRNACFLKMRVVDFFKINVAFCRKNARGIVAEPPSSAKRGEGDGANSPTQATKKASERRLFLCAKRLAL